ncbi:ABC transporter permease [Asanoa sp. NPDC049573]|uniref:ABC transporter permease n=1 Tax=Asanoa sp. NPDC049573 TaxID=3155396 RepID=UPI0034232272
MTAITRPRPATDRADGGEAPSGGFRGLIWLTWRQHRWALIGTLVLATVLVCWMAYLSAEFTDLYRQCHHTLCPEQSPQSNRLAGTSFLIRSYSYLSRLVQFMPMLVGVFIGVPLLSREHDQRTLLLAWSQDVSPARWLWAKLSLLGLFVTIVTAAVAVTSDHMERSLARVSIGSLFQHEQFINTAMLPLVISICWFVAGVALGAAIKRTLPAVFAVAAGFIGLMLLVQYRYPTLLKPLSFYRQLGAQGDGVLDHNALVVSGGLINYGAGDQPSNLYDASRHPLTGAELERLCPPDNGTGTTLSCFADHHLQQYIEYQPGSRIPEFHLIVGAGYLALAVAAVGALWLIIRRTNLSAG